MVSSGLKHVAKSSVFVLKSLTIFSILRKREWVGGNRDIIEAEE